MEPNYWQRIALSSGGRRMGRRRLLQYGGLATAGIAAGAFVGCGDDDDDDPAGSESPTATATPAPAVRGGTLKFGFNRDIQGLDPTKVTDSYVGFIFIG